jgi:hypothetical protein
VLGLAAAAAARPRTPSASLRARVMENASQPAFAFVHSAQGFWLPGSEAPVRTKNLFADGRDRWSTRLVALRAGTTMPQPPLSGGVGLYVVAGALKAAWNVGLGPGEFAALPSPDPSWSVIADSVVLEFSRSTPGEPQLTRGSPGDWRPLAPGILHRTLAFGPSHGGELSLISADPEVSLVAHDHEGLEEMFVLGGSCVVEGVTMTTGDYHRAGENSTHGSTATGPDGCVLLVSTRIA